jgi:hypothetical protein
LALKKGRVGNIKVKHRETEFYNDVSVGIKSIANKRADNSGVKKSTT